MVRSLVVLGAAAALAAGQSTTIDLFLPMFDKQKLVGSVVDADSTATTYAIACPSGANSDDCGLSESQTVTQGPSTWALTMSYAPEEGSYYEELDCSLDFAKDSATCSVYVSQEYDGTTTETSTSEVASSGINSLTMPVTITAGLNKLDAAAPGASSTATAPSTNGAATTTTTTAAVPTGTPTGSASTQTEEAPATMTTPTDNAAMPMMTQHAVLAGVAAIVGGAMAL